MAEQLDNVLHVGDTCEIEALWDRVIVLQDEFRSGYECVTCKGAGDVRCEGCKGTGESLVAQNARCHQCEGRKRVVCPDCGGKGGVLVIPEQAKNKPTTGVVVSVGEKVVKVKLGESVIFPSYVGFHYDLSGTDANGNEFEIPCTVLREEEIIARVKGHLDLRRVRKAAAVGTAA